MSIYVLLLLSLCASFFCFLVLHTVYGACRSAVVLGVTSFLLLVFAIFMDWASGSFSVIEACKSGQYKCEGKIQHTLCLEHDWYGRVCETSEIPKEAFME